LPDSRSAASFITPDVGDHDARAFHGQPFCRRKADAVSRAGDDGASSCQTSHVGPHWSHATFNAMFIAGNRESDQFG